MTASRSGTKTQARGLRKLLEDLEDLQQACGSIVSQARRLAATDDIKPQILRRALSLEAWKEIDPAIFDGVIQQQLSKYERFKQEIGDNSAKQEGLLDRITVNCPV
jgi:programmed cell death 6-interacting protein